MMNTAYWHSSKTLTCGRLEQLEGQDQDMEIFLHEIQYDTHLSYELVLISHCWVPEFRSRTGLLPGDFLVSTRDLTPAYLLKGVNRDRLLNYAWSEALGWDRQNAWRFTFTIHKVLFSRLGKQLMTKCIKQLMAGDKIQQTGKG